MKEENIKNLNAYLAILLLLYRYGVRKSIFFINRSLNNLFYSLYGVKEDLKFLLKCVPN